MGRVLPNLKNCFLKWHHICECTVGYGTETSTSLLPAAPAERCIFSYKSEVPKVERAAGTVKSRLLLCDSLSSSLLHGQFVLRLLSSKTARKRKSLFQFWNKKSFLLVWLGQKIIWTSIFFSSSAPLRAQCQKDARASIRALSIGKQSPGQQSLCSSKCKGSLSVASGVYFPYKHPWIA